MAMPQTNRNRFCRYGPLLAWMLLIYLASTSALSADHTSRFIRPLLIWLFPQISEEKLALAHFFIRKAAHFSEYAILGLLAARAFYHSSQQLLSRQWFLSTALLTIVYAFLDEFHQSFVRSRTASIGDSFIDIAGSLFAILCFHFFRRRSKRGT
jgi:VanZ family protein